MGCWQLQVNVDSKIDVKDWLESEQMGNAVMVTDGEQLSVQFNKISDAFKFRLQFDQDIL